MLKFVIQGACVMVYRVKWWKGFYQPSVAAFQLNKAETIYGVWTRVGWLFVLSLFVSITENFYGMGTESLVRQGLEGIDLYTLSYFALGNLIANWLSAIALLFIPAFFYWILTDIPYIKLVIVQMFIVLLHIIEKITNLLLMYWFQLPWYSSPLSLGVIAQTLEFPTLAIYICSYISIFFVLSIIISYMFLKDLNSSSLLKNMLLVIGWHIILLAYQATYSYIDVTNLVL
jgi:hypothetical protein